MGIEIINTPQAAAWIPEVWARELLTRLRSYTTLARLVNKDYSADISAFGNTVNVNLPPTFTARDVGNIAADTNVALATRPVTLNRHKTVDVFLGDVARAQSRPDVMAAIVDGAAQALAEVIESDLMTLAITLTNVVGTGGTIVDGATLRAARKMLVDNKVPRNAPMSGIFGTTDYAGLMGIEQVTYADRAGETGALRNGIIPRLYGIDSYESQFVTNGGVGNPTHSNNIVFHRDAFALVTRVLEAPLAGVISRTILDSDSGLTFRLTLGYDQIKKGHIMSADILYGVAALRPELGVIVKGKF